jgi:4'-phosphopantetheinyl transferase
VIGCDRRRDENQVGAYCRVNDGWQHPETVPNLGENELHVWRVELARAGCSLQEVHGLLRQSYAVLTGEERERAARLRTGGPWDEFVAGRGCLRRLLGAALEVDPRTVAIEAAEHGKLRLRTGGPGFNVAHSRGVILIALTAGGDVGVDVEFMDPGMELLQVARSEFPAADVARIERASTQDARLREFYRCWTRREAVAKADGRGLLLRARELSSTGDGDVTVLPEGGAGLGRRYFVQEIEAGLGHAAAVASSYPAAVVRCFELGMGSPLLYAE